MKLPSVSGLGKSVASTKGVYSHRHQARVVDKVIFDIPESRPDVPSPHPLIIRACAHGGKYGWLARLVTRVANNVSITEIHSQNFAATQVLQLHKASYTSCALAYEVFPENAERWRFACREVKGHVRNKIYFCMHVIGRWLSIPVHRRVRAYEKVTCIFHVPHIPPCIIHDYTKSYKMIIWL